MESKMVSRRTLFKVVLTGFVFSPVLLVYTAPKPPIQSVSAPLTQNADVPKEQESFGLPMRLKIPKIHVDALVQYVGLAPQGVMDAPSGPTDVAWYNLGPRPGEKGSSVIAGHSGWKNNIPAVFDHLHQLREGDTISIEDEKGGATTFVVRDIQIYGRNDDASNVFGSSDGKAHLNLITCTGDWNTVEKIFSDRLIVFTDKE